MSDFYRSEAFGKFRAAFAAELRQARDIQENSLFALAAIESVRQGKDPVTAVRLAYPPQPPKAPGSSAQA